MFSGLILFSLKNLVNLYLTNGGYSGRLTRLSGYSFRDYLDLLKFRSFNAEIFRHLDNLIRANEIRGLGAEFLNARSKLTTLHRFRDIESNAANSLLGVMQTEVANNHFRRLFVLRMRMNEPAYAIRE